MPIAAHPDQQPMQPMQLVLLVLDLFAQPFISRDSRNLGTDEEHPFRTNPELIE